MKTQQQLIQKVLFLTIRQTNHITQHVDDSSFPLEVGPASDSSNINNKWGDKLKIPLCLNIPPISRPSTPLHFVPVECKANPAREYKHIYYGFYTKLKS